MPAAYSYVRFSSLKQREGTSLERQLEAATHYAHKHGLVLNPATYRDLGVSAFRSKNVEGALGAFIEAVDAGKVAKGDYLLIENFDRLSRDTVDVALELFLSITRRGVVIVTLADDQVYSSATIKENWTKLIMALAVMARANEESVTKSKRAIDVIERRKARGELVTTRLPTWMQFTEDRKGATLIPDRAAIVKEIFERTIKGESSRAIARWLHETKAPVLFYAKEWRQSAVSQLLKNPAAYGHFKGKDGVLPAVVTKDKWQRIQTLTSNRRKWGSGPVKTQHNNVFAGLAFCAMCERRMRRLGGGGTDYLKCIGNFDYKSCQGRMFPLKASEEALVYHLSRKAEGNFGADFFREQTDKRTALEAEIATGKEQQRKLVKLAQLTGDIEVVAEEIKEVGKRLDGLNQELSQVSATPLTRRELTESAALFDIYVKLADQGLDDWNPHGDKTADLAEFRLKLKMILARTVKRVDFWNAQGDNPSMALIVTFINGKTVNIELEKFLPERTRKQHANGIPHRKDLQVIGRRGTRPRSRVGKRSRPTK